MYEETLNDDKLKTFQIIQKTVNIGFVHYADLIYLKQNSQA